MTNLQGSKRGAAHGSPGVGPLGHSSPTKSPLKSMGTGPGHLSALQALLTNQREFLLRRVTEGHLNAALDALRSCQALPRANYETICSAPTLTARIRALLDTCLSLGEEAIQVALTVLVAPPRRRVRGLVTTSYLGPFREGP